MRTRTYGTGSFYKLPSGKYLLRYRGKSHAIEAANNKQATSALQKWVDEIDEEAPGAVDVSMDRLFDLFLADHRRRKLAETYIVEKKLTKLIRPRLGSLKAAAVKRADISDYVDVRLEEKAAPATINRELAIVRRAFKLGIQEELITKIPHVAALPEDNVRQGFVEEHVYRAFLRELPAHAQLPWVFSYYTGIRKGELLRLEWAWMNWDAWVIEVPGPITKNKKVRRIPVYNEMRQFLTMAFAARAPKCPYIFQLNGQRLKNFRTAFENARERLELTHVLFHDLRRTAVRNMELAGIPRTEARQVSGHRTDAIYSRYAVPAEKGAREVGDRMNRFHEETRQRSEQICSEYVVKPEVPASELKQASGANYKQ